MRSVAVGAALLVAMTLAGCSARPPLSSSSSSSSGATAPPVATPFATTGADPLATLDSTLDRVDGAVDQSQSDLSAGDASAAKNDDQ